MLECFAGRTLALSCILTAEMSDFNKNPTQRSGCRSAHKKKINTRVHSSHHKEHIDVSEEEKMSRMWRFS